MSMGRTGRRLWLIARRSFASPLFWVALLLTSLVWLMPWLGPVFAWAFPGVEPPVYARVSFLELLLSHATLVGAASLTSTVLGAGLGVFVTRPAGRDFRAIVSALASIGQTFPPAAVLAIAVPMVGFGSLPTLLALMLYGLLPIVENTIAGLEGVPQPVREVAEGMGLSPLQVLREIELPLAAPIIVAGIRTSVIINIGTATIGSTVGAVTLGTPIISGLVSEKLPYVMQGAIVVGLFAILVDMAFEHLARYLRSAAKTDLVGGRPLTVDAAGSCYSASMLECSACMLGRSSLAARYQRAASASSGLRLSPLGRGSVSYVFASFRAASALPLSAANR
jgi:osmoprotectant transport system permease protein